MSVARRSLACAVLAGALWMPFATGGPLEDPVAGTWVLDLTRSEYHPGPGPRSEVRTYRGTADANTVAWSTVGADGRLSEGHTEFRIDGKVYPVPGSGEYDAIAVKRIDPEIVEARLIRAGKRVGTSRRAVSADGQVMTVSTTLTNRAGVRTSERAVFSRSRP